VGFLLSTPSTTCLARSFFALNVTIPVASFLPLASAYILRPWHLTSSTSILQHLAIVEEEVAGR
jgi:hypothetical protein